MSPIPKGRICPDFDRPTPRDEAARIVAPDSKIYVIWANLEDHDAHIPNNHHGKDEVCPIQDALPTL